MEYPKTRRGDVTEELHGVSVSDPYRWLEDPDTEDSKEWIQSQVSLTSDYLGELPQRDAIRSYLERVWNYERIGIPSQKGERLFWFKNDGLQDHPVFYWREGSGEERVLIDPKTLSEDGSTSIGVISTSDDGRYCAYGTSAGGSDWIELRVREVATGEDLEDRLEWVKFTQPSWMKDGSGFFYSRFPAPPDGEELQQSNEHHKVYFHRLGTPQDADELVFELPLEPKWFLGAQVTEDGRYLIITATMGAATSNSVFVRALDEDNVTPLIAEPEGIYAFVGNDGPHLYFRTNVDAPRGRVISVDLRSPEPEAWRELIPQREEVLESVSMVADRFVARYLSSAHSRVLLYSVGGELERELPLPGLGTLALLSGRRHQRAMYFSFTSFTEPTSVQRYDFDSEEVSLWAKPELPVDTDQFESEQVWYSSKDGTKVSMFLVHKRGLERDGARPVCLYGYGGFNISLTPAFSASQLVWFEMGGVLAIPNLRGGGEYGEEWHEAGMLADKQNVFDDFIAAAEHLIEEGWTSSERLAIKGGSNGGLLVGACMTQRPELFGACLPAVGVMDMLRYHKFTIGSAWVSEYGSPDDEEDFHVLHAYSPLHNLKQGESYPATLICTAERDDRVVPAHSFKYAAALQAAQGGDAPCLIRIETKAGHGAGITISKYIEENADVWAFLAHQFGMDAP